MTSIRGHGARRGRRQRIRDVASMSVASRFKYKAKPRDLSSQLNEFVEYSRIHEKTCFSFYSGKNIKMCQAILSLEARSKRTIMTKTNYKTTKNAEYKH